MKRVEAGRIALSNMPYVFFLGPCILQKINVINGVICSLHTRTLTVYILLQSEYQGLLYCVTVRISECLSCVTGRISECLNCVTVRVSECLILCYCQIRVSIAYSVTVRISDCVYCVTVRISVSILCYSQNIRVCIFSQPRADVRLSSA